MSTPPIHTDVAVTVGSIALIPSAGYQIVGNSLGEPARGWRRHYAESPWVAGSYLVSAVLDHSVLAFGVRVTGTSVQDMRAKMTALLAAVSAFTYTVTVDMEGVTDVWTADPADYTLAGNTWQDGRLRTFHQIVTLSIPVFPIPASSIVGS